MSSAPPADPVASLSSAAPTRPWAGPELARPVLGETAWVPTATSSAMPGCTRASLDLVGAARPRAGNSVNQGSAVVGFVKAGLVVERARVKSVASLVKARLVVGPAKVGVVGVRFEVGRVANWGAM
ncbi:hypothetical protein [Streptomyces sp. SID13031]|uniref:hypothetical protein n=1 Tax=Streptomyces sp. SID13031 TaxID=2706046 RepID=UPI0013CB0A2D|nr:hypothetical protein [Streptomyces sp. SID13031]NEA31030.1 hypothetical protein [Streptomyces sp. SID13031]